MQSCSGAGSPLSQPGSVSGDGFLLGLLPLLHAFPANWQCTPGKLPQSLGRAINYIEQHTEVEDVLISGGDPLTLPVAAGKSACPPETHRAPQTDPDRQQGTRGSAAAHFAESSQHAEEVSSAFHQHTLYASRELTEETKRPVHVWPMSAFLWAVRRFC